MKIILFILKIAGMAMLVMTATTSFASSRPVALDIKAQLRSERFLLADLVLTDEGLKAPDTQSTEQQPIGTVDSEIGERRAEVNQTIQQSKPSQKVDETDPSAVIHERLKNSKNLKFMTSTKIGDAANKSNNANNQSSTGQDNTQGIQVGTTTNSKVAGSVAVSAKSHQEAQDQAGLDNDQNMNFGGIR